MNPFHCVACLLSEDPDEDWAAVTLWDGSAYCLEHLRLRVAADLAESARIDGPEIEYPVVLPAQVPKNVRRYKATRNDGRDDG